MNQWKITLRTIILAIVIGGGAGVLATALTTDYLTGYAVQLEQVTAPLRLAQERPRAFPQTYADSIAFIEERALPGVAEFYPAELAPEAYAADKLLLRGAVLTSDGWILTMGPFDNVRPRMHVVVNREEQAIEEVVADTASGAVFVKVDAQNLPVLAFGSGWNAERGDQVYVLNQSTSFTNAYVSQLRFGQGAPVSSDAPSRTLALDMSGPVGAPVTNLSGELIGVVRADGTVLPIDGVLPAFNSLLRAQAIVRPSLGLTGRDLTHELIVSNDDQSRAGTLVTGPRAVPPSSPAGKAGVKEGDIILSLNGQPINGYRTLDEFLLDLSPGESVVLHILREGVELDLTATLGELEKTL